MGSGGANNANNGNTNDENGANNAEGAYLIGLINGEKGLELVINTTGNPPVSSPVDKNVAKIYSEKFDGTLAGLLATLVAARDMNVEELRSLLFRNATPGVLETDENIQVIQTILSTESRKPLSQRPLAKSLLEKHPREHWELTLNAEQLKLQCLHHLIVKLGEMIDEKKKDCGEIPNGMDKKNDKDDHDHGKGGGDGLKA